MELNRRQFVTAAAAAAAACLCTLGNSANLLAATAPTTGPTTLDAGPKSSYTADGITDTWMKAPYKIAVIRNAGKIYASTTICTHKGCTIKKADNTGFACPCHHAAFDIAGNVTHRPAKVPLLRYAINVDATGHLIVDKTKSFTPDQWTDPASFVTVD